MSCDEAVLTSCLERLPASEEPSLGRWGDDQSPTVPEFVADFYGGSTTDQQDVAQNLQADGLQAITHELYQSEASNAPSGDIIVLRFNLPREVAWTT